MFKKIEALSVLIGTIIGAGVLGIPYVVMRSGFSIGLFHLIFLAILMILAGLYLGEIALRTKGAHQLTGYAEKYLGKTGKKLMMLAFAFGIYSALLAYLTGEGISISHLIFGSSNNAFLMGIIFWVCLSTLSYFGLKSLRKGETLGVSAIIILIFLILILFWNKIDVSNLSYANYQNFFVPFGVILFAYLGFSTIPEAKAILGKDKGDIKRIIIGANLLVFVVYTLFALVVLGSLGISTPQIATISLGKIFILLGIFTMLTSYLALSVALIDMFKLDYKMSHAKSWILTSILPFIIYIFLELFNIANFTKILGIGGTISGGLTAILIVLMAEKAKKKGDVKPEYSIPLPKIIKWAIIVIFTLGALFEIFPNLI